MARCPGNTWIGSNTPTVGSCLKYAAEQLESNGILESHLKAEWILSHVIQCRRLELLPQKDGELTGCQFEHLLSFVQRLASGEPLQYALGNTEFMGRMFKTDLRALIPRPETETLVENVLACEDVWASKHPAVADVGTGTGCIIISLALERPQGNYVALDASEVALDLSRENAKALGVEEKITFVRGDLMEGVLPRSLNLVVSNLPYISTDQMETLPPDVRHHEPRMALDGGPDGFSIIARFVPQAYHSLGPDGRLFMEVGEDQGERASHCMRDNGFGEVEIRKDWAGQDRIACGRKRL